MRMKSSIKYVFITSVVIISVLNLRINFQRTESGNIDLSSLCISSTNAYSEGVPSESDSGSDHPCRCHTSDMTCQDGSWVSFRPTCNCFYNPCRD